MSELRSEIEKLKAEKTRLEESNKSLQYVFIMAFQ